MPVTIVGNNTPTAGGVVYGDGTNYASTAAGTSGQVLQSNGASAPTWSTPAGGFSTMQVFTSSGTFTIPTGKTTVKVTVVGGGGGGASNGSCVGSVAGCNGGSSSIASGTQSITTITGGGGTGGTTTNPGTGTTGGTATNGDINIQGGGSPGTIKLGGATLFGFGGRPTNGSNAVAGAGTLYGGGGGGGNVGNLSGGGGGGTAIKYLTGLTPGNTISVTVGNGGASSTPPGASFGHGGAGAAGVVIFEY